MDRYLVTQWNSDDLELNDDEVDNAEDKRDEEDEIKSQSRNWAICFMGPAYFEKRLKNKAKATAKCPKTNKFYQPQLMETVKEEMDTDYTYNINCMQFLILVWW